MSASIDPPRLRRHQQSCQARVIVVCSYAWLPRAAPPLPSYRANGPAVHINLDASERPMFERLCLIGRSPGTWGFRRQLPLETPLPWLHIIVLRVSWNGPGQRSRRRGRRLVEAFCPVLPADTPSPQPRPRTTRHNWSSSLAMPTHGRRTAQMETAQCRAASDRPARSWPRVSVFPSLFQPAQDVARLSQGEFRPGKKTFPECGLLPLAVGSGFDQGRNQH